MGQMINDVRGGHSNIQLKGAQEMVHRLILFDNETWDGQHVKLTSEPKQDKPSLAFMVEYDEYTYTSIAGFFFGHKDMPPATSPCMHDFRMFS